MTIKKPIVNCPYCGNIVLWDASNPFRPFCSERCKMIDLGQWASEAYRVPETEQRKDETPKDEK